MLTDDIDGVGRTCEALRVVLDHIGSFEDALDRASFDVELIVAEAVLSAVESADSGSLISIPDSPSYLSSDEKFQSVTAPYPRSFLIRTLILPTTCLIMLSPRIMTFSKRLKISQISSVENQRMSHPRGM